MLTTTVIPVDIAGGTTVIISAQGDNVRIGSTPSLDNYFTVFDSVAGLQPLTVPSTDERLYVRADAGMSILSIWVVR
jgi:hypothetical protein